MYIFLLACIPLVLLLVCCSNGTYSWKSFIPAIVFGFLVAFVFCVFKKFIVFNKYTWTMDMVPAIMNLLVYNVIIPLLVCLAVMFIFDRSKIGYKAEAVAPLMLTYYAIMIPFDVLVGDDSIAPFMIYGKPLLYAGSVLFMSIFAALGVDSFKKRIYPVGAVCLVLALAINVVPAIVEAYWYYTDSSICILFAGIFAGAGLVVYLGRSFVKTVLNKKA